MYTFFLFVLLPVAFGQYAIDNDMKPDVRFDDRNERYDIGPLMDPGEYLEKEFRRQGGRRSQKVQYYDPNKTTRNILRMINKNMENGTPEDDAMVPKLVELLRHVARRAGEEINVNDWAWHDDMKSMENQNNFERNLEKFRAKGPKGRRNQDINLVDYLHGQPEVSISRRSEMNPDKEVLLHHAVPIVMNVQGFLKRPTVTE